MHRLLSGIVLLYGWALWPGWLCAQNSTEGSDFQRQVAPLLATRCLGCHSGGEAKGQLDLSTRDGLLRGGESGAVLAQDKPLDSLLWQQVADGAMPPKQPLAADEKAILQKWIAGGAKWSGPAIDPLAYTSDTRAGLDWWALQPIARPTPSNTASGYAIDGFIHQAHATAGVTAAATADRRTLIRRLYFDLLGLPPAPEDVSAFQSDPREDAYDRLVDRLLASPHYGERWGRHWLDIVRFGESNGFEYDEPRDNFWHYRNWVIQALNEDLPYDQFVRMQIAGDAIAPGQYAAAASAGFLVAGPHNTTLPSNTKMRMAMAQDEMEDLIGIIGQTFLGLTVHCARCHDHKFDPISQKEYYQLAAALSGVTHGERSVTVELDGWQRKRLTEIGEDLVRTESAIESMVAPVRERIRRSRLPQGNSIAPPAATATWEFDGDLNDTQGKLALTASGGARVEDGALVLDGKRAMAASPLLARSVGEKTLEVWVQLTDLDQRGGGAISLETKDGNVFDAIVYGEKEPGKWMAGSNSFTRTQSFSAHSPESEGLKQPVHIAIVYAADGTISAYRNGQAYGQPYRLGPVQPFEANSSRFVFGIRHSPVGGNKMLAGRIERAQFYDRALTAEEVELSGAYNETDNVPRSVILRELAESDRQRLEQFDSRRLALREEKSQLLKAQTRLVYTCLSGKLEPTRVLLRGDVSTPGDPVHPAGLRALAVVPVEWNLGNDAPDAQRRLKMSEWLTHPQNPLLARVIVNRLWHYHFGQGMIATPSDFGFNGGYPSHPELLDWLANELIEHQFSLKAVQRLIVTSRTYRQSSAVDQANMEKDVGNKWLWRFAPQRLEAETLRDTVLAITERLDRQMGGRGYRDMKHYFFKGSNFYELLEESAPEARRRTIYRFTPRGATNPFLSTFDCPDPSATAPRRPVTTTPLQALAMMNNALIFEMADALAARVERECARDGAMQIARMYELVLQRQPGRVEMSRAATFVGQHDLPSLGRVLFNSNEFLTIE